MEAAGTSKTLVSTSQHGNTPQSIIFELSKRGVL